MKWYYITPLLLQKLVWIPTRFILLFFCKVNVIGLNNLKTVNTNVIFAANHSSQLDPILLPASLGFFSKFSPIFYASRENSFYKSSFFASFLYSELFFKMWGAHKVYVGLKDYSKSLVTQIKLLNDGKNLFVFPEGKISRDGNLLPVRGGLGYLMFETRLPIIPVSISGAYNMSFSDFVFRRRTISIHFDKPIFIDNIDKKISHLGMTDSNIYKSYSQYVLDQISKNIIYENK